MATDAQDLHKHRRSPSDEEDGGDDDKSSKRHKHRHHHHHHRRHRHGSRKQGGESKPISDDTKASPPLIATRPYEEVEEGEILDDEAFDGIPNNRPQSDAESTGVFDQSHNPNLGLGNANSYSEAKGKSNGHLRTLEKDVSNEKDKGDKAPDRKESFPRNSTIETEDDMNSRVSLAGESNSHSNYRSHKMDRRQRESVESASPSRGSDEKNNYHDDGKMDGGRSKMGDQTKSSSQSTRENYKTVVHSPSHDRYYDKARHRSRSRSYDPERSRSHSAMEEEALHKRRRYLADKDNTSHDNRTTHGHDYGDIPRDDKRERNAGYSSRHVVDDRHNSRDAWTREGSREREVDADRKREKERAKSRDREIEKDRRRERECERSRDWDLDRERRKEVEAYRSRDREVDRARKRDKERDRSLERGIAVDRSRGSDRDRYSDRTMDRKQEKRDDDYRAKGRDRERDRERDKHESIEDMHNGRDRNRYSRNARHDQRDYRKDESEKTDPPTFHSSKDNHAVVDNVEAKRYEDEQEDNEETSTLQLAEQEEEDLNRIKEESRRRRQAILEKYKNKQVQQQTGTGAHSEDAEKANPGPSISSSSSLQGDVDRVPDGVDIFAVEPSCSEGKSRPPNGVVEPAGTVGSGGLREGTLKSERPDGMFCDDIFGETPTGIRKSGNGDGLRVERSALHDNWDDAEGYYSYRYGELLDGRYEITASHGKGVFSTVVRARNIKASNEEPEEVAIKIIRSNDTMYKAGMTELVILKKLVGQDPENKRHCVRFLSSFKYRNHLCLVFESLHMNLREVLKKFGRNIGLKLTAVRAYAKQLFIALKHLKNCGVLHCDIKPDNMLVNEAKNVLKLCDFGNAMFAGKNEITPYLVSRFYRAPEIILGLPYDHPLDIWSVGCCLYELYTGKVLFPGATNNDMLRLHMELKGPFPKKMLRKGAFTEQNFDQDLNFHATEEDPVTKKTIRRLILNVKPKDIGSIIAGSPGEDPKMLAEFKDLLDKMFVLDPDKRLTVSQALSHPFITGK